MDKWQKFIDEARKKKRRRCKNTSAPPGAPGGLEEEVEEETFEKKATLAPKIWEGEQLIPRVSDRILKIARDFIENLDKNIEIEDIRFTGSLANYNWSKYSDVDLHIVVDFDKIDEDTELVKSYFDAVRMNWNNLHNIKIRGYEVEIYVENVGEDHRSSGIYSVTNSDWVVKPDAENVNIDFVTARKKSDDIATQVNLIGRILDNGKPKSALKSVERLKDKIRRMRRTGLDSDQQEYSAENIAFKILRREDILQKLNDLKYDAYDQLMSLA